MPCIIHLGNMHLLSARLCGSTGPTALNMASMVHALMGLRNQQETQILGEILMSDELSRANARGSWDGQGAVRACMRSHCHHLRGILVFPQPLSSLDPSQSQSAPVQTLSEIRNIH